VKRKEPERVERRRPQVELNLLGEVRARSAKASRGCAALLGRLLIDALLLGLLVVGLS
jgi:hypothetical protein